ncbi:MAG: hypothetical protein N4J56_007239 [Chroococcidiopsis sp. SAG 2025]|uniref:hypothetical protein n=1 Tax=Chroococcidiopsis sp. SAG 2025 TaxID=171389 RepID=UPI002937491A|nr:hypothetical protein [Chroococcidiopsis sp. SAG 2025]MDV2997534.1 hypothetical protein [Chroococcidiopsis sp. SAG 2025]
MSEINSCQLLQLARFVLTASGLRHFQLQRQGKCHVQILIQGCLFLSAFSCLTTFVAITNLTALAQTVPPLPPTNDPSRIERGIVNLIG